MGHKAGKPSEAQIHKNIRQVEKELHLKMPVELEEFLVESDGGECLFNNITVEFWPSSELVRLNRDYEAENYAVGVLLFGSDKEQHLFGVTVKGNTPSYVVLPKAPSSAKVLILVAASLREMMAKMADTGLIGLID